MVDRIPHNENRRNCALVDQFAHKTDGVNRTKNVRFSRSDCIGYAPCKENAGNTVFFNPKNSCHPVEEMKGADAVDNFS